MHYVSVNIMGRSQRLRQIDILAIQQGTLLKSFGMYQMAFAGLLFNNKKHQKRANNTVMQMYSFQLSSCP